MVLASAGDEMAAGAETREMMPVFCTRNELEHWGHLIFKPESGIRWSSTLYARAHSGQLTFIVCWASEPFGVSYTLDRNTFVLTLTNPATILSFAAIFSGLGLAGRQSDIRFAVILVSGVFIGSALWWLTLSTGVSIIRSRLTTTGLLWINRLSGIMIGGFGLLILLNLMAENPFN